MDYKEFYRAIMAQEIEVGCTFCEGTMWVEFHEGKPHLMRLSEMEISDCPICTEIHEEIE